MAKVFILNYNPEKFDYKAAEEFGTLIAVTQGMQPVFKINQLIHSVHAALKDFQENDYIVLTGPSNLVMIASVYLLQKFIRLNILIFDAQSSKYVPKLLNYYNVIEQGD